MRGLQKEEIRTYKRYREWIATRTEWMGELFALPNVDGIASITTYVSPSFHPQLPLVLLNYTSTAHNTLHTFSGGWSRPIMQCRGIVYDLETATRVALPFEKFFGNVHHPEAAELAERESHVILAKEDGHLGIIFPYRDQIMLTTRGVFTSPSAKLGAKMLAPFFRRRAWKPDQLDGLTLMAEMIHPKMHVLVDYGRLRRFVLIGATETESTHEYDMEDLRKLSERLGWGLPSVWSGTVPELERHMRDRSVRNQEGYVLWFPEHGLRIKYKYDAYLGRMFAGKLSYAYVMRCLIAGTWEEKFHKLDEDIQPRARQLADMVRRVVTIPHAEGRDANKAKRAYLHHLVFKEERTSYYKDVCRRFLRFLASAST